MDKYQSQVKSEELARQYIEDMSADDLQACFFIATEDGCAVLPVPPKPPDVDRSELTDVTEKVLRFSLKMFGATGYVFVMEAWTTESQKFIQGQATMEELPLDDKAEYVYLFSIVKHEQIRAWRAPVYRTPNGRKLGNFTEEVTLKFGGYYLFQDW